MSWYISTWCNQSLRLFLSCSQTHTTQSVSVIPIFKVLLLLVFVKRCEEWPAKPAGYRGMYEMYAFTAQVNLITALSIHPRSSLPSFYLTNHSDIHCILVRCRGPRHPPLDTAFPFNRLCNRVGVYLLLERIWKSIAIKRSCIRASNAVGTVLNY